MTMDRMSECRGRQEAGSDPTRQFGAPLSPFNSEHNLDVIKTADWIIDLGPEGGIGGGEIVVAGTPAEVAAHAGSYTGQFLKHTLEQQTVDRKQTVPA